MTPEQQITLDQLEELLLKVRQMNILGESDFNNVMKLADDELAILRTIRLIKEQL
jgi:hypothetical protein